MALTAKEKSKIYRERKIAEMGLEKFRKLEAEKRKARRKASKPVEVKPVEVKEPVEVKPQQVIDFQNIKGLGRLYNYITGDKFEATPVQFEIFRDVKNVIEKIHSNPKWKSKNTKNKYLENLSAILKTMPDYEKEYKIYSEKSVQGRQEISKIGDDLKLTEQERKIFTDWKTIVKVLKNKKITEYEKSLVGLYILMPPRRRSVAQYLTLADDGTELNPKFNYILNGEIIINNYKTKKTFGTQKFKIPVRLNKILMKHINKNNIKVGSPIFPTKTGKYHSGPALSKLFSDIFDKYIGKRLTFNLLRHSKITDFLSKKRTITARKKLAYQMGHSAETQARYERLI
jgi:hypothetical protein